MSQYVVILAYKGTRYAGWQIQENAETVQGTIERALSLLLREPISIMGCGRTDKGVHASAFLAHFDFSGNLPSNIVFRMNGMLPTDIHVRNVFKVPDDFHARFSARKRTYKYLLDFSPSIYLEDAYYYYPYQKNIQTQRMVEAASILPDYEDFFCFCKSRVQVDHYKCHLIESHWEQVSDSRWIYTVQANRFLRGMVRLIVGMCLNVGRGRISLDEVKTCLTQQKKLPNPWSVPAEGLYLYEIDYEDQLPTKVSSNPLFFPI